MQTFFNRAEFVAAVEARGLQLITTQHGEDFAHGTYNGQGGNFGVGDYVPEGEGTEGSYVATLFETVSEFEREYLAGLPLGQPTGE